MDAINSERPEKSGAFPRRLLTVPEFCTAYAVSRTRFYALVKTGKTKTVLIGGTSRRIAVDEAERFAQESVAPARPSHFSNSKKVKHECGGCEI
jgi:predicted DNA-binding transcriptional regulator AlpA